MRKRRLRLALFAVALLGVVAWLEWPTSSPVIAAAKEKYARLQLGMSEAELVAILGDSPDEDRQLYGEWGINRDGRDYIHLNRPTDTGEPGPRERPYRVRTWTFYDGGMSWRAYQEVQFIVYCEQGRLVAIRYAELYDGVGKRTVRELASRLSIRSTSLDVKMVKEEYQTIPPP
jgi:hypothetical protein